MDSQSSRLSASYAAMTSDAEPIQTGPEGPASAADGQTRLGPPWPRILLLGVCVAVLLGIVYLSPLRQYLGHLREISTQIRSMGWLGPVTLACGIALLVAVGFPRLLFCVIAGMALGFWWGLFWAQLGTLVGNYTVFLLARLGGGAWAQAYVARRGKLHDLIRREGMAGVVLARQVPMPGLVINLACGLLPIRHRHYLLGTILGQLPEAVPCTLIGAGALAGSVGKSATAIGLAVILAVLFWIGLRWALQRKTRSASPAD